MLSFGCLSNTHMCTAVIFNRFLAGELTETGAWLFIYWTQEFILVSIMSRSTFISSHQLGTTWDFLTSDAVILNSFLQVQRLRQVINFSIHSTQKFSLESVTGSTFFNEFTLMRHHVIFLITCLVLTSPSYCDWFSNVIT